MYLSWKQRPAEQTEDWISCITQDFHFRCFADTRLGGRNKQTDVAVVSGFHSRLEKDVLKFLLQGKCGIIVVLARGMYRKLPKIYDTAMNENRLLIIALEKETVTRVSEYTAQKRNNMIKILADNCFSLNF